MWSVVKKVSYLLGFGEEEPEIDIDEVRRVLSEEQQQEDEGGAEEGIIRRQDLLEEHDGVGCQNRSGIVTLLSDDYGFVDGKLCFNLKDCPLDVRIGDCVTYIAYRLFADDEWRISKILIVQDRSWDDDNGTQTAEPAAPVINKVLDTILKNIVGKVHERNGREVTIVPDMVTFNLDSVSSDFVPIIGDWIELEALVQTNVYDNDSGDVDGSGDTGDVVLQVNSIRPLRSRVQVGRVTHWDTRTFVGTISTGILFTRDALDFGYIPTVGDEVVVDAIESDQIGFIWRALTVVSVHKTAHLEEKQAADRELSTLLTDKEGVIISRECSFGEMLVGDEKSISVSVTNDGDKDHWITKAEFVSESQMNLMAPLIRHGPLQLPAGKSLTFKFKARARFIGKSSEMFVWTFECFKIGRNLELNVTSDLTNNCIQEEKVSDVYSSKNYNSVRNIEMAWFDRALERSGNNGVIVSGVRPMKNPSFIPVRLGNFILPKKLIKIFLNGGDMSFGHGEKRLTPSKLKDEYPCLGETLNPTSYSERLHTLLFLEEVENIYRMNQFNIERGYFRHSGKYLSLFVEGLSERRPSLIVGDRVIASPCTYKGESNCMSYEGYIHKIQYNEILVQFGERFHQICDGEYRVKFEMSRGNFVKCHQAVKLVHKFLKASWLFPTCVKYKPAQIIITDEAEYVGNTENISTNEGSGVGENIDGRHVMKSTAVVPDTSNQNEVISSGTDKLKDCCIVDSHDSVNSDINSQSNISKNEKNIINLSAATNRDSEIECLSISSSQVNNIADENFNNCEKLRNVLGKSNPDSSKGRPPTTTAATVDNNVNVVTEVEESKRVNQSLRSSTKHVAVITDQTGVGKSNLDSNKGRPPNNSNNIGGGSDDDDDVISIVSLESEEIKRVNQNLYKSAERIIANSIDQTSTTDSVAINKKVKSVFDHFKSTQTENSINRNGKENIEAVNKIRTVEEIERFSLQGGNVRKTSADKMSTSSSNDVNLKKAVTKRESATKKPPNKHERNKKNYWFDEGSDEDEKSEIVYETIKRKVYWFNHRLNHYQKEAVRSVLKGEARPLPYVIFGPPGTGKTITLVETILQIYHLIPESRLLIGTPSNSSADLISERLLDSGVLIPGTLTRLVGFNYMQESRLPVSLLPYCAVASMAGVKDNNAQSMVIGRNRITVGTCNTLGILYNAGFPKGHFTHVIVDEAGQATEPELLIPLAFLNARRGQSVLAGDPNQLGPVILSRYAKEFGLGESFLVRLLHTSPYRKDEVGFRDTNGYNPHLVTLLIDNYRSLPEILTLPSTLFYNCLLVPRVNEKDSQEIAVLKRVCAALELPPTRSDGRLPSAVLFHGIHGQDLQTEESPSWFNPHEIAQSVMYLQGLYDGGLTPEECGILTPYNKQAAKIRQMINRLHMEAPKVGSVEEFQGQERMAIILSSVRSSRQYLSHDIKHNMGFIACPRRLNVALTRARAMLIIIGDPHLLVMDVYWKSVLEYCVKNDAYRGCDLPYSLCDNE